MVGVHFHWFLMVLKLDDIIRVCQMKGSSISVLNLQNWYS